MIVSYNVYMKVNDVIILGAGASGLMCGVFLPKNLDIVMLEHNEKIAKKVKISGGGKCNITNVSVSANNYDGDELALEYAFEVFSKEELLKFLEQNGVEVTLRKGRYYFCKESSQEVIDLLHVKTKHIKKYLQHQINQVTKKEKLFYIETNKGVFCAKKVIVATGGKSFSSVGASDIGLKIAKDFGVKTKEFTPALVGLTVQKEQFFFKELSGLSTYVHISVADKILKEDMLFTHKGLSGPAVLSASLYWKKGEISIDFLPNHTIEQLVKNSKKLLSSTLPLPKRLSKALLEAVGVEDIFCSKIDEKTMKKLQKLHCYTFAPAGNFGFTKAEVSRGGVLSSELKVDSLEAKKVKGLYFIGEVVDVTGELGGYNFQWAFSSAYYCSKNIN